MQTEYFTAERLARCRQLHRRYPLWCGHWPDDLAAAPERTMWTFRRRARFEGRELRRRALEVQNFDRGRRLAFVVLRDGIVQRREPPVVSGRFWDFDAIGRQGSSFEIPITIPRPEHELLQAIAYTLAHWPLSDDDSEPEAGLGEVDPIDCYTARLTSELRHSYPIFGEAFERSRPYRWNFGTANEFLQSTERGDRERQAWVTRLRDQWFKLGEEIGIVPRLAGGAKCTLPAHFLGLLEAEAKKLSEEIRCYEPVTDDLQAILRMLMGDAAFQSASDNAQALADAKRQRRKTANGESLRWADGHITQYGADTWALRLAFPMLTAPEIELLQNGKRRAARGKGRRPAPTDRVLAARLGISAGTLQNLLSKT